MAEPKLKPSGESVAAILDRMDATRRAEAEALIAIMKRASGEPPKIWASGLIGFGNYHYKYASGHQGDCFVVGFAARKTALTLYITAGVQRFPSQLAKLGKHKEGKGCVYIKKLDDVNLSVLEDLLTRSVTWTRETHPA